MTLNQLRYFCAAARCRSITRAAQELYITQPTISAAIRELEIEFKMTFFYRTGNQLVLTQEGELFYERAAGLLRASAELQEDFSQQANLRSSLRVGIPPMLSTVFFPELLDRFQEAYPDIRVRLDEYGSLRACGLVQDDHLDLAIVNMEVYNLDKLNSRLMTEDRIIYCVSPSHRLAGRTAVTLNELAGEEMIFFNADSMLNQLLTTRFEALNIRPNIVMRSSQLYTTLKCLQSGTRGCFLFASMLEGLPGAVGIELEPPVKTRIGLVWKKGKYVSSRMQKFLDFAADFRFPDKTK